MTELALSDASEFVAIALVESAERADGAIDALVGGVCVDLPPNVDQRFDVDGHELRGRGELGEKHSTAAAVDSELEDSFRPEPAEQPRVLLDFGSEFEDEEVAFFDAERTALEKVRRHSLKRRVADLEAVALHPLDHRPDNLAAGEGYCGSVTRTCSIPTKTESL